MTTKPQDTRPIEARGPAAGAEDLRAAYLDLLKLTLCDLANARTESVMLTIDHTGMFSKQSTPEELVHRATGMHWSLHGLTMVGLTRLDDLQRCVESVVRDGVEGDLIEAGSWRGGAALVVGAAPGSVGGAPGHVGGGHPLPGVPPGHHGPPPGGGRHHPGG